jgi:hypothetical protein
VINSMRQVGGSIGIAVMGALFATKLDVGPTDPLYPDQFVAGFHLALDVAAALAFAGAIVAVVTIRRIHHPDETAEPVATVARAQQRHARPDLRHCGIQGQSMHGWVDRVADRGVRPPLLRA